MSTINARPYSSPKNINLTKGLLRFGAVQGIASTPFDTSSYGLYVNSSGNLAYSKLGAVTVLGGGGGGAGTWETLFLADSTFTITPDVTWTIAGNRVTATDVLTLTNTGGASGDVLKIQNSGTGADISGTDDLWTISVAGAATFAGVTPGGDITSTATAIDWDLADNNASALSFDAGAAAGILEIVTTDGSELVKFGKNIQVTDGIATCISTSNTVSNILVTNNTVTTFGANADSSGVVVIRSTSLTTGALLQLQATEGTLNGGFYLVARDVTGSANVFTLAEDGKVTIAGADGSDMLVITAGDATVGGSLALTDNDNAASFTVTNNTATSASVVVIAGSGVFTGSTTSSFMTISPSGITTGTAIYIPADTLTTGKLIDITVDGLTTGEVIDINHTTSVIADGGSIIRVTSTGIDTGGATNGTLLDLKSTAQLAGTLVRLDSIATTGTMMSMIGTGIMTTTGNVLTVTANSATTAAGLVRINANGLTSGIGMVITSSTTVLTGAGRLFRVDHTGNAGDASGVVAEIASAAADETVVFRVTGSAALAAGVLVDLSAAALTTGTVLDMGGLAAITTGKGIVLAASGTTRTDGILVDISCASTAATATGRMLLVNHTGITSTSSIIAEMKSAAADETVVLQVLNSAANTGAVLNVSAAASVTGIVGQFVATAATLTTGRYLSCNDGAVEVFGVGANGHIHTVQSTAPTIAVTAENGISAAAITAGASDVAGIITTTGTNNNGGASVLRITFHKTYTAAPKAVILTARNQSAAKGSSTAGAGIYGLPYVSTIAATHFDVTIPADSAATATPSWNYVVIA
jgi:hypothetical protein